MTLLRGETRIEWSLGELGEANALLREHHYLGPQRRALVVVLGRDDAGAVVAAQVWGKPTSRRLPSDGSWLELSRWCLTPGAGDYAGSRMHAASTRLLRLERSWNRATGAVAYTTLVSYSDPSHGHTGALYRSCNWRWCPTWLRLRPPPTGNGAWSGSDVKAVKDRWIFPLSHDARRADLLRVNDRGAIRAWRAGADEQALRLAARSLAPDLVEAVTS